MAKKNDDGDQGGDERDWSDGVWSIVLRVQRSLLRHFRGLLTEEDIEDVMQEACSASHSTWSRYDPQKGSVLTWFSRIAYFQAVNLLRRLGHRKCPCGRAKRKPDLNCTKCCGRGWLKPGKSSAKEEIEQLVDPKSPNPTESSNLVVALPDPNLALEESIELWGSLNEKKRVAWKRFMSTLSDSQRRVFWLWCCKALPPFRELSEAWGIREGTLRKALHDAKIKLKSLPLDVLCDLTDLAGERLRELLRERTSGRPKKKRSSAPPAANPRGEEADGDTPGNHD